MLQLIVDNKVVETNRICFSDGAVSFDLKDFSVHSSNVMIGVDSGFKVNGLLDELSQLCSAIAYTPIACQVTLSIPYLPYGRHDRKFSEFGNTGLKEFVYNLAELGVNKIHVVDPHNPQALEDICDNASIQLEYMTQLQAFREVVKREHLAPRFEWDVIIAPDKGAKGKAQKIADYYGLPLVCCTKERDVATGKLSNPFVPERLDGKKVLIVDDLLDNGGTYIQLAQELYKQGAEFIDLYVTHLIAAKGLNVLTNSIHKIYTYHTCCGYVTMQDVQKFNKGEI